MGDGANGIAIPTLIVYTRLHQPGNLPLGCRDSRGQVPARSTGKPVPSKASRLGNGKAELEIFLAFHMGKTSFLFRKRHPDGNSRNPADFIKKVGFQENYVEIQAKRLSEKDVNIEIGTFMDIRDTRQVTHMTSNFLHSHEKSTPGPLGGWFSQL